MKTRTRGILLFVLLAMLVLLNSSTLIAQEYTQKPGPSLGWNSYDCYGTHIS